MNVIAEVKYTIYIFKYIIYVTKLINTTGHIQAL